MDDGQDLINVGSELWATLPPFEHGQKMGDMIFSKYFLPVRYQDRFMVFIREYYVQKDNYCEINPLKLAFDTVFI